MKMTKLITPPLVSADIELLCAGDKVTVSGTIYTARDMAHKRIVQALEYEETLPFDLKGAVIYFTGPTPDIPGRAIGSAGPTTSSRMDRFSCVLIKAGLKAMIGKGYRGRQVIDALVEYKAVHFSALGGAGALLSKYITHSEIIAYHDLGTEAVRKLTVQDFPVIVAYDSKGNSVYKENVT